MKSRLRKVNERKEKENFSLDKAIKYIKENDNIRQKFNDYLLTLPRGLLSNKELFKYLISYDIWNYLITKFKNMDEIPWYKYNKQDTQEIFVVQNPGNYIDNPLIRFNKYYGFTNQDEIQDTIIVSYEVSEKGIVNYNNFKVLVEPEKVVNMAVQNPNMPDIYIDGKPYMYGGKNFQEADIKRKQIVQERNKGINYN